MGVGGHDYFGDPVLYVLPILFFVSFPREGGRLLVMHDGNGNGTVRAVTRMESMYHKSVCHLLLDCFFYNMHLLNLQFQFYSCSFQSPPEAFAPGNSF
jgi:hypothetical protein